MALFFTTPGKIFDLFILFTYIFYGSAIIGVSFIKPSWFLTVDFWAKVYVAVFLIIRYNPFLQKPKYTPLDRKVSFHAGVFILVTILTKTVLVHLLGKELTMGKGFRNLFSWTTN